MINRGELEGRLDSFYYKKVFRDFITKIKKSHFDIVHLNLITSKITDGTHHTPTYIKNGVKFISVKDIKNNEINFNKTKFISENEHNKLIKRCHPEVNDIVFTKIGTLCQTALIKNHYEKFSLFVSVALIKINNNKLLSNYLVYLLSSNIIKQQVKRTVKGIGVPDFHLEDIKKLLIPLPSNNIQQNIIDIMDNAYKVKKEKEKESKNLFDSIDNYLLDNLGITLPDEPDNTIENRTFKVGFDDVFSDRLDANSYTAYYQHIFNALKTSTTHFTTLKNITIKIKTGTTPNQKLSPFTTDMENIPFLRNSDIQDGEIVSDKFKYVKNELSKYLTFSYKDEIIICIAGTIGVTALNTYEKLSINQNVSSLTIDKSQININFLMYWLNTKVAINLMERLASIATISYINNPTLLRLQIPIPDIDIQNEIVKEISQRRIKAKHLQTEAKNELEKAKKEVENIILGENNGKS